MIGVILPTRGLVYTQVEDALERVRDMVRLKVFRSYNLPIPDAQNTLVEEALKTDITHLWFVEEDTVPPKNALPMMFIANDDIVCIDYGVNGYSCVAKDSKTNEVLWCGFGCTLVKRQVFEKMEKPWFRTDKTLRLNDGQWTDNPAKYGGQDIWFCVRAREEGFRIKALPGECIHLKLQDLGRPEENKGMHKIIERPKIQKQQYIDLANKLP